jgi:uncharacterized NAD(P)/FAD-binding protein YdhS
VPNVTQSEDPVLLDLLLSGAARQDALGLGFDVTDACEVTAASVGGSERIYALGPVTAGSFWEIVAIPDIRQQAKRLAEQLAPRAQ